MRSKSSPLVTTKSSTGQDHSRSRTLMSCWVSSGDWYPRRAFAMPSTFSPESMKSGRRDYCSSAMVLEECACLRAGSSTRRLQSRRSDGMAVTADLATRYRSTHVVLVPSVSTPTWVEQFGRVIVEAQASGAVVAGYASGAIPRSSGRSSGSRLGGGLLRTGDRPRHPSRAAERLRAPTGRGPRSRTGSHVAASRRAASRPLSRRHRRRRHSALSICKSGETPRCSARTVRPDRDDSRRHSPFCPTGTREYHDFDSSWGHDRPHCQLGRCCLPSERGLETVEPKHAWQSPAVRTAVLRRGGALERVHE